MFDFSRTYARLLRPKLAEIMLEAPPVNTALRLAFDRLKSEIDACCEDQRLAASCLSGFLSMPQQVVGAPEAVQRRGMSAAPRICL